MSKAPVHIIMGSRSDWPTMELATKPLQALAVDYETSIVSAHRTPQRLYAFCRDSETNGTKVIIAGAGGAAHLAGMAAAMTWLPVIAVPVQSKYLKGMDSLLSMVQMPKGVAVATQAIGEAGAYNAGLLASQMLALSDPELQQRLVDWRRAQTDAVAEEVE
ncbi:5-(carboxyamino)imidazole ribonucleotide mutase [Exilibacterium tricleocarpae]|uniref:N5-carboxyaminoimidazole ribonucleotide mutase n=1 Tax=Exilibacterium tricleocarpae TaxID=2591008 RepID=A0A545SZZ6_9GAMM|nr:5-(carboxyamino)imidazole ribonucleotide mutase [Exilibacterium tricleocarpae]TQV70530.1 5-(carboxyamino)imidazole ribonucleotide mutase [Exilibacterium tricleocarpae]